MPRSSFRAGLFWLFVPSFLAVLVIAGWERMTGDAVPDPEETFSIVLPAAPAEVEYWEIEEEEEEEDEPAVGVPGGTPAVVADGRPLAEVVRLGTRPDITRERSPGATEAEAEHIRGLIRQLAAIDDQWIPPRASWNFGSFSPIEAMPGPGARFVTSRQVPSPPALRELVALGPKSLPFLLDALDDRTPTNAAVREDFGTIQFERNLGVNPANPAERAMCDAWLEPVRGLHAGSYRKKYTLKVGDLCLDAIGQIVGRHYPCLMWMPGGSFLVRSPTRDARMCRQVRAIWSGDDAAQMLFDSLRIDGATEGIPDGDSLGSWTIGADLQIHAVERLLYYFPAESAGWIAGRLDGLDLAGPKLGDPPRPDSEELARLREQCLANGVRAPEFLQAVVWCEEPRIRAALARAFARTTDPEIALIALRSLAPDDLPAALARLARMLDDLPAGEGGPYDAAGGDLLVALGEYDGPGARPIFRKYLDTRTREHALTACLALRRVCPEWAAELLAPLLDDRRELVGLAYRISPAWDAPTLPVRVCDEAAETIALANPDLHFDRHGTHADLDRQIRAMQAALASPPE